MGNKRIKKICAILAIMSMMILAACSGGNSGVPTDGKSSSNSSTDNKVEIKWLMRSNPFENKWQKEQVIPKFEEQYPNIKVNLIVVPPEEVDSKLSSMVAAGDPPDVFSMWGDSGFSDYYNRGMLMDLTEYVEKDLDKADFVDGIFDIYAVDGQYFSVPQVTNFGLMMVYNKDLFAEAGLPDLPTSWDNDTWTWDQMIEYAKKLTKNYGEGTNAQYGIAPNFEPHQIAYMWGTDAYLPENYETGLATESNYDDPAFIKGLQATADLTYKHKVAPTPADTRTLEQLGNIFLTGKIGMAFMLPTQAYGNLKDAPFKWGLAPVPRAEDNKTALFNGAYFIAKDSKHPDEAWKLIDYLLTPEAAKDMSETTGFLVPHNNAVEEWLDLFVEPTGMDKEELREVITNYPENSVENINHTFVNYREMATIANQGLDQLWMGKATAEETIEILKPKVDQILKRTYDEFSDEEKD
ncbi:sugar ABC transporter substrate-binding protein [Bacillus sp. J14TS2]|uniref:ABC transporter substrate-binding protein n=1 Tax=Bacillus sp. J14TS2 TaxID=2807188 RepID=UPI001B2532CD|nr:sugar ABC transporter substrate-binding protein [Bacillus sp. J14TS2]GIN71575.1 sugar ABC transporter substrate-binding protein [Bacillus sp. J14TS2]